MNIYALNEKTKPYLKVMSDAYIVEKCRYNEKWTVEVECQVKVF